MQCIQYIFAICMAALICVVLALFVIAAMYEFLEAAYDVVSNWVRELEREWRYVRMKKKWQ